MSQSQDECRHLAGAFFPYVSLKRCEGKADCIAACPYSVFELSPIRSGDKAALNPLQRFKLWVHGGKVAYAVKPDACRACGHCVTACPEHAITLKKGGA